MIVGLNGATGTIGSAIVDRLVGKYDVVQVTSRLPDIESTIEEIELAECDVFINNAMYEWSQVELLTALYEKWKGHHKHIINIGSRAASPNISPGFKYSTVKAALNHFSDLARFKDCGKVCKVTTINPGLVGEFEDIAIDPYDVADAVEWAIKQPAYLEVSRIDLQHTAPFNYVQDVKAARRGNKC